MNLTNIAPHHTSVFRQAPLVAWIVIVLQGFYGSPLLSAEPLEEALKEATLQIIGVDGKSNTYDFEELRQLPTSSIEVTDNQNNKHVYTGISLHDLMKSAGVPQGNELRKEKMRLIGLVEARDDYKAAFALAEFDPLFTDRTILLAATIDGKSLPEDEGPLLIVVPGEKRHARWVKWVIRIRILDSDTMSISKP